MHGQQALPSLAPMPKWSALEAWMTNERWGWILVALAAVLMGALTRAPAVAAKVHDRVTSAVHVVSPRPTAP